MRKGHLRQAHLSRRACPRGIAGQPAHAAVERVGAAFGWPSARSAASQPRMASRPLVIGCLDRRPVRHAARQIGKLDQTAAALVLGPAADRPRRRLPAPWPPQRSPRPKVAIMPSGALSRRRPPAPAIRGTNSKITESSQREPRYVVPCAGSAPFTIVDNVAIGCPLDSSRRFAAPSKEPARIRAPSLLHAIEPTMPS